MSNIINFTNVINFQAAKDRIKGVDDPLPANLNEATIFDNDDDITEFALLVSFDLVDTLGEFGINIETDPNVFRDILSLIEAIKAIIYRTKRDPYSWHKITDQLGDFKDEEMPDLLREYLQKLVDTFH